MTTTDTSTTPPSAPHRALRRSRSDRVAAGVAGGLGEYFGLDPVLFRVLFAVSAFFGGAGLLAYVLAWAAIPEQGTQRAAVDGWIAELRRRRVPFWVLVVLSVLVLWGVAFSWWAPGPFFPVLIVVVVLVVLFGRRGDQQWTPPQPTQPPSGPPPYSPPASSPQPSSPPPSDQAGTPTVDLSKEQPPEPSAGYAPAYPPAPSGAPDWVSSARQWIGESKQASRERRRRAFPVRIGVLVTLIATLIALGVSDAVGGIRLPVYFWCTGGIVALGLLVGMVLRRTPWSMALLLIPVVAGMVAFGNTSASLHDGVGATTWSPSTAAQLHDNYRLAFGQATLDLRDMSAPVIAHDVSITMAAGQITVDLPRTLNATVHANVRIGEIDVDGHQVATTEGGSVRRFSGYDIAHTVLPEAVASGAPITITVHLADGNISVNHY